MKRTVLYFLTFVLISMPLCAQRLKVELWLNTSGEYLEYDEGLVENMIDEGWRRPREDEDASGFILKRNFVAEQLPWSLSSGKFDLSVSKEGVASISFSYGDSDGGANADTQLPLNKKGEVIKSVKPYTLNLSGGDHASGMWEADAQLTIKVLKNK
ncbi:MAG TPA: hypothetical protein VJB34_03565 [Bdellovibrionota bacterium]|nr:hypothetical protein [Bdellovibrionota bacterium]